MHTTIAFRIGTFVLAALTLMTAVHGDIIQTTGSAIEVPAPVSVVPHDNESDINVLAFYESTQVLANDLLVDADGPGTWTAPTTGTISAGTEVNSYYLHADKVGSSASGVPYSGSITFDEVIVGVIGNFNRLNASNFLGNPGTLYSTVANRGWEFSASEFFTISADRKTLTFANSNSTVADQLRIITRSIPEPSVGLLASLASLGLVLFGRNRRCR